MHSQRVSRDCHDRMKGHIVRPIGKLLCIASGRNMLLPAFLIRTSVQHCLSLLSLTYALAAQERISRHISDLQGVLCSGMLKPQTKTEQT